VVEYQLNLAVHDERAFSTSYIPHIGQLGNKRPTRKKKSVHRILFLLGRSRRTPPRNLPRLLARCLAGRRRPAPAPALPRRRPAPAPALPRRRPAPPHAAYIAGRRLPRRRLPWPTPPGSQTPPRSRSAVPPPAQHHSGGAQSVTVPSSSRRCAR
jgi:hypothetical protein